MRMRTYTWQRGTEHEETAATRSATLWGAHKASRTLCLPDATSCLRLCTQHYETYEISYIAKSAGDFELCVWCEPDTSHERQWLTGSPFLVRVTGLLPSTEGSFVEASVLDLVAGDTLSLRPQLRDQVHACRSPKSRPPHLCRSRRERSRESVELR
jgi:hypothetical protein